jgi:thiol-disulfide isomerase/thioredoxin
MKKIFATLLLLGAVYIAKAQFGTYENTKIKLGQQAPELEFKDTAGNVLKLSDINKGRVVLLDFWASWCHPCRMASPKVKAMYTAYHKKKFKNAKKGFTVVSVSLDQQHDPWVAAIKQDSLYWPYHMSDLGGWKSKPADIYGIQYIPQAFLIDSDGKVIGKYNMAEEAEADIKKLVKEKKKKG